MAKGDYLGEFEQVVLLAVARLDEGYGVTIRQEIEARTGRETSVGGVYATLDRLEEKGMLRSWEGEPTGRRGGRARRHFELTAPGREALTQSRDMIEALWEGLDLRPGEA